MAKLTQEEARQLAANFRDAAIAAGDNLQENWSRYTPKERSELQALEVTLMNHAADMTTQAIGLMLDEAEQDLTSLMRITARGKRALKSVAKAKAVITVLSAVIGLAAAIQTKKLPVIKAAADALQEAMEELPKNTRECLN